MTQVPGRKKVVTSKRIRIRWHRSCLRLWLCRKKMSGNQNSPTPMALSRYKRQGKRLPLQMWHRLCLPSGSPQASFRMTQRRSNTRIWMSWRKTSKRMRRWWWWTWLITRETSIKMVVESMRMGGSMAVKISRPWLMTRPWQESWAVRAVKTWESTTMSSISNSWCKKRVWSISQPSISISSICRVRITWSRRRPLCQMKTSKTSFPKST